MTHSNLIQSLNPLIESARPLFVLANTMQQTHSQLSTERLLDKIALMIGEFEQQAEAKGVTYELIQAAKYCLCTFLDEQAVRANWADESWAQKSLLVTFYNETWGGERFFEMLDNLKQQPEKNMDLLELMYLCLQFGHKGKYQVLPNGDLQIDKIKRDLSAVIRQQNIHQIAAFPKYQPNKVSTANKNWSIPLWAIAICAIVSVGMAYFVMQRMLADQFNVASTAVNNLTLPIETRQPETRQVQRLVPLLKNEIDRKWVSVADLPDRSVVTILGDGLFESGSATIQDQYFPVLAVIGQALNSTEGQVIISGYTDDQPIRGVAFPSNWHLSQGRADAVKEILTKYVANGTTRIRAEGRGETNPVAENDSPENRAKNRRVEITLFITGNGARLGTEITTESNTASHINSVQ